MGAFLYHGIRFFLSVDFLLFHGSHKPLGYLSGPGDGCPGHRGQNASVTFQYAVLRLTPTHSYRPSLQPEHIQLFCLVSVLYPSDIFLKALQL